MLSQFTKEHEHHKTLADLEFTFPKDVYPIGRLDADSEGLLLLSNDRSLNKKMLDPKSKRTKTYWAQLEGAITDSDISPLRDGIRIRTKGKVFSCLPAKVRVLHKLPKLPERNPPIRVRKTVPDSWAEIILVEGKNRQVRKMFAAIGFPVLRLIRVSVGDYHLIENGSFSLAPGDVRII